MILCSGSIGLDTVRTPFKTVERVLGGAATYFAYSASFFDEVSIVSAVGGDFDERYWKMLEEKGIDLSGVEKKAGEKTFAYDCSFGYDLNARKTNKTELNVLDGYQPVVPKRLAEKKSALYLATSPPAVQLHALAQCAPSLCFLDTIELFIETGKPELMELFSKTDGVVINEYEARMIAGTPNLLKAGKFLQELGPSVVIVKKGEHGCLLFFGGAVYPFPAFPLEEVVDPSGAGDAFAGGVMGYLSKRRITREKLSARELRKAICYGTVMASFTVEGFSLEKLREISFDDVQERLEQYRGLLKI